MQDHPRWTDHSGEFSQNMIHWRREWQSTLTSHENPINCIKRQKDMTPKDELTRSEGDQYAAREEWRTATSSSRKNEAAGPKQKRCLAVDMSGDKSKIQCCKDQYCTGT